MVQAFFHVSVLFSTNITYAFCCIKKEPKNFKTNWILLNKDYKYKCLVIQKFRGNRKKITSEVGVADTVGGIN